MRAGEDIIQEAHLKFHQYGGTLTRHIRQEWWRARTVMWRREALEHITLEGLEPYQGIDYEMLLTYQEWAEANPHKVKQLFGDDRKAKSRIRQELATLLGVSLCK